MNIPERYQHILFNNNCSETRYSISGVCNCLGYTDRWLYQRLTRESTWLSELKDSGFTAELITVVISRTTGRGATRVRTISHNDAKLLFEYETLKGNTYAAKILSGSNFNPKKIENKQEEKKIQPRMLEKLGGKIEFPTPVGNRDLVTDEEIIEIKAWSQWKSALGQVLAYSYYLPNKKPRVHLYGKFSGKNFLH